MTDAIDEVFQDVADAIRSQTGETEAMAPTEFAAKIAALSKLPTVTADDNGKVLQVVDGAWAAADVASGASEVPVFDLVALGLATVAPAGVAQITTNTAEVRAALEKGPVKFIMSLYLGASERVSVVMNGASVQGGYACTGTLLVEGEPISVRVRIMDNVIRVQLVVDPSLPTVSTAENGKVLQVVEGAWVAAEVEAAKVPTFDLAALGLQTLTVGSQKNLSIDTTEIRAALDKGPVRFIVSVNLGLTLHTGIIVNNVSSGGDYICSHFMNPYVFEFTVTTSGVQVLLTSLEDVFPPGVTEDDDGKLLQVVDGVWCAVTVAGSSIKTYIDDYINEALGGDY